MQLGVARFHLPLHPFTPTLLCHAHLEVRGLADVLTQLLAHFGAVHIYYKHLSGLAYQCHEGVGQR